MQDKNRPWRRTRFGRRLCQGGAGVDDAPAGLLERLGRGGVGDTKARRNPERLALDHGDPLHFEQIGHEVGIGFDLLAVGRGLADDAGAGRIDLERPDRALASQPFGLV